MMHSSQQPPAAVHHYQLQERVPAYHRPTPSPQKRRQDTLTQNEWGARLIPSGWAEHRDGSGEKFYIHKKTKRYAPTYEHMFVEGQEEEAKEEPVLTQRSSSSANSQAEESESSSPRKKSRRIQEETIIVETDDLPGSNFSLDFAQRKEAEEVNKENDFKSSNERGREVDGDDNDGEQNESDEGSSQGTQW